MVRQARPLTLFSATSRKINKKMRARALLRSTPRKTVRIRSAVLRRVGGEGKAVIVAITA